MVNIGIIGAENFHARHFCKVINAKDAYPGYKVSCIYGDDSPENAQALATDFGLEICNDVESLIAQSDAVVVTYRKGSLHHVPVMQALQAGKPVFNDKPFAITREEASEIATYAETHRLLLTGGSNLKDLPEITALKAQQNGSEDILISFSADPESPYDGYWFYGMHSAEIALTLCGTNYTEVTAFRNGDSVSAVIQFPMRKCIITTTHLSGDLNIVFSDKGTSQRHVVPLNYESVGPDNFIKMLSSGHAPLNYDFYVQATALVEEIVRQIQK